MPVINNTVIMHLKIYEEGRSHVKHSYYIHTYTKTEATEHILNRRVSKGKNREKSIGEKK